MTMTPLQLYLSNLVLEKCGEGGGGRVEFVVDNAKSPPTISSSNHNIITALDVEDPLLRSSSSSSSSTSSTSSNHSTTRWVEGDETSSSSSSSPSVYPTLLHEVDPNHPGAAVAITRNSSGKSNGYPFPIYLERPAIVRGSSINSSSTLPTCPIRQRSLSLEYDFDEESNGSSTSTTMIPTSNSSSSSSNSIFRRPRSDTDALAMTTNTTTTTNIKGRPPLLPKKKILTWANGTKPFLVTSKNNKNKQKGPSTRTTTTTVSSKGGPPPTMVNPSPPLSVRKMYPDVTFPSSSTSPREETENTRMVLASASKLTTTETFDVVSSPTSRNVSDDVLVQNEEDDRVSPLVGIPSPSNRKNAFLSQKLSEAMLQMVVSSPTRSHFGSIADHHHHDPQEDIRVSPLASFARSLSKTLFGNEKNNVLDTPSKQAPVLPIRRPSATPPSIRKPGIGMMMMMKHQQQQLEPGSGSFTATTTSNSSHTTTTTPSGTTFGKQTIASLPQVVLPPPLTSSPLPPPPPPPPPPVSVVTITTPPNGVSGVASRKRPTSIFQKLTKRR